MPAVRKASLSGYNGKAIVLYVRSSSFSTVRIFARGVSSSWAAEMA